MSQTEVWMCYGCCCGVADVDGRYKPRREPIDRIRSAIQAKLAQSGQRDIPIRKTGCLGPCSKGNMVVVHKPGVDAVVFQGINSKSLGEKVAAFAVARECRGWGAEVSADLEPHLYGAVAADEVESPPSPEPYADRH